MSNHGYRYTGTGERFRGVPARDLSQREYDALGTREQRSVVESGVYQEVVLTDFSLDDLKAMAVKDGAADDAVAKLRTKADVITEIEKLAAAKMPPAPVLAPEPVVAGNEPDKKGDNS